MPGPDIYTSPDDPIFAAAFRHLLEEKGLNQKEFCELTRPAPGADRRIAPSTASTWVTGKGQPSNQAAWLVAQVLGVERSQLWHLGETLWKLRETSSRKELRRRAEQERDLEAVQEIFAELDDSQVEYLLEARQHRKEKLAS